MSTSGVSKAPPVTEALLGAQRVLTALCELFDKLKRTNTFNYLDSPTVRDSRFDDSLHKTVDSFVGK